MPGLLRHLCALLRTLHTTQSEGEAQPTNAAERDKHTHPGIPQLDMMLCGGEQYRVIMRPGHASYREWMVAEYKLRRYVSY